MFDIINKEESYEVLSGDYEEVKQLILSKVN